jgi:predicted dehydrogenase
MNVQDVDRIYEVAEKKHVSVCVVHQNVFNPAVKKVRHLVEGGAVGDLTAVDVGTFVTRDYHVCLDKAHWSHKLPGGIFFETLPHPVYLLQLFLKKIEPACVIAEKSQFPWMKADVIKVLIKGEEGQGSLEASCNSPYHGDSLMILGTKMGLQVDLWARSIIKYGRRTESPYSIGKSSLKTASQSLGLIGTTIGNTLKMAFGGVKVSAHYEFIRKYLESILYDEAPPVSRAEARENVRVVESICKAVDNIFEPTE